jgi:hypothetical protein
MKSSLGITGLFALLPLIPVQNPPNPTKQRELTMEANRCLLRYWSTPYFIPAERTEEFCLSGSISDFLIPQAVVATDTMVARQDAKDVLRGFTNLFVRRKTKFMPSSQISLIATGPALGVVDHKYQYKCLIRKANHISLTMEIQHLPINTCRNPLSLPIAVITLDNLAQGRYSVEVNWVWQSPDEAEKPTSEKCAFAVE